MNNLKSQLSKLKEVRVRVYYINGGANEGVIKEVGDDYLKLNNALIIPFTAIEKIDRF